MTFNLEFLPSTLKEWNKLGAALRTQMRKKLAEWLETPRVPADALHGLKDHFKIKLRPAGYRLVYRVEGKTVTVIVVAAGRRERKSVYKAADDARRGDRS